MVISTCGTSGERNEYFPTSTLIDRRTDHLKTYWIDQYRVVACVSTLTGLLWIRYPSSSNWCNLSINWIEGIDYEANTTRSAHRKLCRR